MIRILRSLFVIIGFGIFGLNAFFLNVLVFPFIKNNKELCSDIIHNLWKFLINLLALIRIIKLDIKRLDKIENKVIAATHPSFIDIVILMALIPRSTCFVKKELAQNPILNNIINSIFITNEVEIDELQTQSKSMLERGFNVIIFPSGIRHRKNEYPKIKKGASLIALSSGKNIVPIRIFSDKDFLFINQPFYSASDGVVTFEIETCDEIKLDEFEGKTEIAAKKEITEKVRKILYNLENEEL